MLSMSILVIRKKPKPRPRQREGERFNAITAKSVITGLVSRKYRKVEIYHEGDETKMMDLSDRPGLISKRR